MEGEVRPVGVLVPPLVKANPTAKASKKSAPANETSLASTSAGSGARAAIGAGVAAGVCACVLGGLAWLRRRALLGRRRSG